MSVNRSDEKPTLSGAATGNCAGEFVAAPAATLPFDIHTASSALAAPTTRFPTTLFIGRNTLYTSRTNRTARIRGERHSRDRQLQVSSAADHHRLDNPLQGRALVTEAGQRHLQRLPRSNARTAQNRIDVQRSSITAGRIAAHLQCHHALGCLVDTIID